MQWPSKNPDDYYDPSVARPMEGEAAAELPWAFRGAPVLLAAAVVVAQGLIDEWSWEPLAVSFHLVSAFSLAVVYGVWRLRRWRAARRAASGESRHPSGLL